MRKDLSVFKEIRLRANSGLYKYRTKEQIDSIYNWAEKEIENSYTFLDFYNIICKLTDFEGSLHNDTELPSKFWESLQNEAFGYFPYPIKWIDGKWRINFKNDEIPIGSEIVAINETSISEVMQNLYKYYTTDGVNTTGKRIGINTHFSTYYRYHYGVMKNFKVEYKEPNSNHKNIKLIKNVGYSEYYKNFRNRYSKPYDQIYYTHLAENQKYQYQTIDDSTGVLTIHSFSMGNKNSDEHKRYAQFLDSIFLKINSEKIKNLIVDVRQNRGGDDPNDLVTYSYLAQRSFQENKSAWVSFNKIPLIRYIDFWLPKFLRPLFVGKYNKELQEEFPLEKCKKYYQDDHNIDHYKRSPKENNFTGNIYLVAP